MEEAPHIFSLRQLAKKARSPMFLFHPHSYSLRCLHRIPCNVKLPSTSVGEGLTFGKGESRCQVVGRKLSCKAGSPGLHLSRPLDNTGSILNACKHDTIAHFLLLSNISPLFVQHFSQLRAKLKRRQEGSGCQLTGHKA